MSVIHFCTQSQLSHSTNLTFTLRNGLQTPLLSDIEIASTIHLNPSEPQKSALPTPLNPTFNPVGLAPLSPPVTECDAMLSGVLEIFGNGTLTLAIEAAKAVYEEKLFEKPSTALPSLTTQLNSVWTPSAGGPLELMRSKQKSADNAAKKVSQNIRRSHIRF